MLFTYGAGAAAAAGRGDHAQALPRRSFAVLIALVLFRETHRPLSLGSGRHRLCRRAGGDAAGQLALAEGVTTAGVIVGLIAPFMVALISFQIQDLKHHRKPVEHRCSGLPH